LKKIWVEHSTDNLKDGNFKQDTLRDTILKITESILTKETISLSKDKLDFSGNLDAQKIRELATKYGFEIGKDFTVRELENFKDETLVFLSDVINKIEQFIIHKQYIRIKN